MSVILIFILPLILAGFWLKLFLTKQRQGLTSGGISFLIMLAVGFWTIFQSRSSTAAIGIAFLPFYACLCGLLGWLFARYKNHSQFAMQITAWAFLAANLILYSLWIQDAFQQKHKNKERDKAHLIREEKINENRKFIQNKFIENKGHEAEWLNPKILIREKDDLFLIPALETFFVKPEVLEKLSHSEFSSVILMVARNPFTSSQTLGEIYANSSADGYYNQALAAHKNTPVEILRGLYEQSKPHLPMDNWLAENPSTPKDILLKLSKSTEVLTLMSLMKNTVLDCELNRFVQANLNRRDLVDTYKYLNNVRALSNEFEVQKCQR